MPEQSHHPQDTTVLESTQIEQARATIRSLNPRQEFATHLGVTWENLRHVVYRANDSERYREFTIQKRHGGLRAICAPVPELKQIQRLILEKVLYPIYKAKPCVHGFARDRSIITGASEHTRATWILNVDLEDFFPSINFGRVFGCLKGRPYLFPPGLAALIAQACC